MRRISPSVPLSWKIPPFSRHPQRPTGWSLVPVILGLSCGLSAGLDFNNDIRPILSEHCYSCHGFDENGRKSGLRLDTREGALSAAKSGIVAIIPGQAHDSELVKRLLTADPDDLMPPVKHGKPLTPRQITLLQEWITAGAPYARHWAFEPPQKHPAPQVQDTRWIRNPVDAFVLHPLEKQNLTPSPEADKASLLRRVTLDLTGLPPSVTELETFLSDPSPDAYERAVGRLLDSPHFGERMAVDWLDAARYADTNGYFGDKTRSAWPWRQWVIQAFNRNMPFDQFTIEQLAGDLLPRPSRDQLIATGFHRNSMANNESGIIDEEYRVETIVDRLDVTSTTWMGLTVGCAQCHDHKFDPISQKDYFQLFAFFNNTPEKGTIREDTPPPVIEVPAPAQTAELQRLQKATANAEARFAPLSAPLKKALAEWEQTAAQELAHPIQDKPLARWAFDEKPADSSFRESGPGTLLYESGVLGSGALFDGTRHLEGPADLPIESDRPWSIALWIKSTGSLSGILSKIEPEGHRRGFEMLWQKGRVNIHLVNRWGASAIEVATRDPLSRNQWQHLIINYDGSGKAAGVQLLADGVEVPLQIHRDNLSGSIGNDLPLLLGRRDSGLGFYGHLDEFQMLPRLVSLAEARRWFWSERLTGILAAPDKKRSPADKTLVEDYYISQHAASEMRQAHQQVRLAREAQANLRASIPTALVMQELPTPRETFVLMRGVYDQPGAMVLPDVPSAFGTFPEDAPRNRLGLARWLVSSENPLTARVIVNRLWQQCFGDGLVRTVEDFGSQGEPPTHPALLDWLSVTFMESGWDVKALLRYIVTSATYRQTSRATPSLLQRDPENRLLARGPRFRMSAEMLRDQALAVSGLLVNELGGPSVKPFQPPGLWEAVSYNAEESYTVDGGAGQWRRSLYTFWKRQAPPPGTLAFDGPTREKCSIRRARTNTPLQALVLLNDETYLKAAAALAKITSSQPGDDDQRLDHLFRCVTSRRPGMDEITALKTLLEKQRHRFAIEPAAAKELLSGDEEASAELAAWTVVAHTLLNLDEAITRR